MPSCFSNKTFGCLSPLKNIAHQTHASQVHTSQVHTSQVHTSQVHTSVQRLCLKALIDNEPQLNKRLHVINTFFPEHYYESAFDLSTSTIRMNVKLFILQGAVVFTLLML